MTLTDSILNVLVTPAYADAGAPPQGGGSSLFIMLIVFVFFMYFAMWRPQAKRAKEHKNLLDSLAKGDEVMTAGGILGRVVRITDSYIVLSISDSVEIVLQKSSIANVLPKGTLKAI